MTLRKASFQHQSWPLKNAFTISRGSKTQANVIEIIITEEMYIGRAECVPYSRYDETIDSVIDQINQAIPLIESGANIKTLNESMPAGAARNAIDCAMWDLKSKKAKKNIADLINFNEPEHSRTAQTISMNRPEKMAEEAKQFKNYPLLKVKLGQNNIIDCITAVKEVNPNAKFIIDANEAWTIEILNTVSKQLKDLGVVLIEQPLPADSDQKLSKYNQHIALCADESFHTSIDLNHVRNLYQYVNIKLDKTGGLSEAIKSIAMANQYNLGIMVGCMVGTSLAMAPAYLLSGQAEFVDLDGPALLAKDRINGFSFNEGYMSKKSPFLWGEV